MEQTVTENPKLRSPQMAGANSGQFWSEPDLVTEDPATFLIAHHILITDQSSVTTIKKYFSRSPGVLEIVDDVLVEMEKAALISVKGDHIKVNQQFVDFGSDVENLRRFVPRLFMIAADRVLADAASGTHRTKRDAIRYWAIPNDQKSSLEAQAAYLEYRAKMTAIAERIKTEERSGDSVRLVGVFNCSLSPEDFS